MIDGTQRSVGPPIEKWGRNDWIIISSIDWSRNWQIHHHLATSLLDQGCRVLFVENTGARGLRVGDLKRVIDRCKNWWKSTHGFRDQRENLTILSPLMLPFPYFRPAIWINQLIIGRALSKWLRVTSFRDPVVVSFLPTPLALGLVNSIDPSAAVYYCADNMSAGSEGAAALFVHEERFFARMDAVFCTSESLIERAGRFNKACHFLPAGVDFEVFARARAESLVPTFVSKLQGPIIGFVGSVRAILDQPLILAAAQVLPHANFVFIGPITCDISLLQKCSNIHFLGAQPYSSIPSYIKQFDVALIPFVVNEFTDAVYPVKLNEYLAMGIPVVATALREICAFSDRHPGVVDVIANAEQLVFKIREAIAGNNQDIKVRRIEVARQNSWAGRFEKITGVIDSIVAEKQARPVRWQERMLALYRRERLRLIRPAFMLVALYALMFFTPLPWWAGNGLVVKGEAVRADAILVFSGDGEGSYINFGHQKRALDALRLYRAGYSDRILLASARRQVLSEAEVMRSLLIERGVPGAAITIIPGNPASTRENIDISAEAVRGMGLKRLLFVTAPYHSLRASMGWRRNAPDLQVTVAPVADMPSTTPLWRSRVEYVRLVVFEYVALGYYWLRGWV